VTLLTNVPLLVPTTSSALPSPGHQLIKPDGGGTHAGGLSGTAKSARRELREKNATVPRTTIRVFIGSNPFYFPIRACRLCGSPERTSIKIVKTVFQNYSNGIWNKQLRLGSFLSVHPDQAGSRQGQQLVLRKFHVKQPVNHHAGHRHVHPQRPGPACDFFVKLEAFLLCPI
jgi:hypothetical protein